MGNWLQELTKSNTDKWIGGVCGGLGQHSPLPSWVWRFMFSFLVLDIYAEKSFN
jgi:phage shock protein PspC (stress-responsive transcriptional regulator)